jgi:hypothetical protein
MIASGVFRFIIFFIFIKEAVRSCSPRAEYNLD